MNKPVLLSLPGQWQALFIFTPRGMVRAGKFSAKRQGQVGHACDVFAAQPEVEGCFTIDPGPANDYLRINGCSVSLWVDRDRSLVFRAMHTLSNSWKVCSFGLASVSSVFEFSDRKQGFQSAIFESLRLPGGPGTLTPGWQETFQADKGMAYAIWLRDIGREDLIQRLPVVNKEIFFSLEHGTKLGQFLTEILTGLDEEENEN